MPREIALVSAEPLDLGLLLAAATAVDRRLAARGVLNGWAVQLVDPDGVAVLTIEQSRRLDQTGDLARILGSDAPAGAVWWTEATAPWGPAGEPGVRVAYAIAERTDARIAVTESG